MDGVDRIHVEIACALPERQLIVELDVPEGATVADAVRLSGILERFPQLDAITLKFGVFGEETDPDRPVANGDRVEIYRPLIADPKEVRRRLAAEGKTMGRKKR